MARQLRDDQIRWILSLDAKGVQSELVNISSSTQKLEADNKRLQAELKEANKQMRETEKQMQRMAAAGKAESAEYRQLERTLEGVNEEIADYSRRLRENRRAIEENSRMADEMVRTLRYEDMTMSQLRQTARDLERQLNNTSQATNPEAYRQLQGELTSVRSRMGELNAGSQQTTSTMKGGLMVLAGNLMMSAISKLKDLAVAAWDWVKGGLEAAGVIEGVARAFNKLDKTGVLLEKLREQTRNLISDDDLQKAAVRADKYKINIEEVGNLLEFAGRRATDMGKSVQDFQQRIIDGIGKESKLILDDLGLTSTEINAAIAETGDFASGVIKVVNEELEKQGKLELTAADIRQQKTVAWANAQGEVGEKLLWIEKIWNKLSIDFAGDVQEWASETLPGLIQKVVDLYNWFVDLYNESVVFRSAIEGISFAFDVIWNNVKAAVVTAIDQFKMLGNVIKGVLTLDWDLVEQSAKNFGNSVKDTYTDVWKDTEEGYNQMVDRINNNKADRLEIPLAGENEAAGTGQTIRKRTDPDATKKQKTAQQLALEELETKHQEKLKKIKEKYRSGEISNESAFSRELFSQEQAYYILREKLLETFIAKTKDKELKSNLLKELSDIQNKRLDQEIKFRSELEKIILNADPVGKEQKEYEERLSAVGLFGLAKKNMTAEQLQAFELLEKQHLTNLENIQKQAKAREKAQSEEEFEKSFNERKEELQLELNDLMATQAATGRAGYDAEMEVHMKKLQMIQEEIAARKAAGLETDKLVQQLGRTEAQMTATIRKENEKRQAQYSHYASMIGTATSEFFSGQKSGLEAFGGSMIDILFDVLGQIVNQKIIEATAVAIAEQAKAAAIAAAMPDSVFTFGASAAARTAAISAIIMGALQVAKSALKGMIGKKKSSSSSSSGSGGGGSTSGSITLRKRYAEGGYNDPGIVGGYTGDGGRYEPAGVFPNGSIFDRGEYIVPQPVLKIPAAIPYINALEAMRKPYSTANPLPKRFAEGGFNSYEDDLEMLSGSNGTMNRLIRVLELLENKDFTPYLGATQLQAQLDNLNKETKRFSQK